MRLCSGDAKVALYIHRERGGEGYLQIRLSGISGVKGNEQSTYEVISHPKENLLPRSHRCYHIPASCKQLRYTNPPIVSSPNPANICHVPVRHNMILLCASSLINHESPTLKSHLECSYSKTPIWDEGLEHRPSSQ
jgi:hypothetical protein